MQGMVKAESSPFSGYDSSQVSCPRPSLDVVLPPQDSSVASPSPREIAISSGHFVWLRLMVLALKSRMI